MAVRPHANAWHLPLIVVLFYPIYSINRESAASSDHEFIDPRRFPQIHLVHQLCYFFQADSLGPPILALKDDTKSAGPTQRIVDRLGRGNIATTIRRGGMCEPLRIAVTRRVRNNVVDEALKSFIVQRIPFEWRSKPQRLRAEFDPRQTSLDALTTIPQALHQCTRVGLRLIA
jgi:hypothetical protein